MEAWRNLLVCTWYNPFECKLRQASTLRTLNLLENSQEAEYQKAGRERDSRLATHNPMAHFKKRQRRHTSGQQARNSQPNGAREREITTLATIGMATKLCGFYC